jgi:hypothetical protein
LVEAPKVREIGKEARWFCGIRRLSSKIDKEAAARLVFLLVIIFGFHSALLPSLPDSEGPFGREESFPPSPFTESAITAFSCLGDGFAPLGTGRGWDPTGASSLPSQTDTVSRRKMEARHVPKIAWI